VSDNDLGAALRRMLLDIDPVPEAAYGAAIDALGWRDFEGAYARLTSEVGAAEELAHVRGRPPRLLTFTSGGTIIVLEVSVTDETVRLLGQLEPPAEAQVTVEAPRDSRVVRADSRGRFTVGDLAGGWMRLAVAFAAPDAGNSTTEWFHS
jgi:hypothetical protein